MDSVLRCVSASQLLRSTPRAALLDRDCLDALGEYLDDVPACVGQVAWRPTIAYPQHPRSMSSGELVCSSSSDDGPELRPGSNLLLWLDPTSRTVEPLASNVTLRHVDRAAGRLIVEEHAGAEPGHELGTRLIALTRDTRGAFYAHFKYPTDLCQIRTTHR